MITFKHAPSVSLVLTASIFALAGSAHADFVGQNILGPLSAGSTVNGTLIGATDENDGFFSGAHIFDIWDGGDEVYALNWLGGTIHIELNGLGGDPDLFLYVPGSLDESLLDSTRGSFDQVTLPNAAAGTYYILIDTTFGSEGAFQLAVSPVPAPGAAALLGLGFVTMASGRRRRRSA